MANIKSQIKRIKTNEIRRIKNKSVRSELKTRIKTAINAVENQEENSIESLKLAVKKLDKAAASGVIHKNQAARRKGRLMARLSKISQD
ncbi:MAG: 30S ribosomal protein S20 [Acidimicrobiaceae bacterium]|nr:30S ribosomal protein S20 [Acidimicrobiaceae bacterium]